MKGQREARDEWGHREAGRKKEGLLWKIKRRQQEDERR